MITTPCTQQIFIYKTIITGSKNKWTQAMFTLHPLHSKRLANQKNIPLLKCHSLSFKTTQTLQNWKLVQAGKTVVCVTQSSLAITMEADKMKRKEAKT